MKHILLFTTSALLLSSCNVYRCRPIKNMELTAGNQTSTEVATTNTAPKEVQATASTPSPIAKPEAATVSTNSSKDFASTKNAPKVSARNGSPVAKVSRGKLIKAIKKLKHAKPDDVSDFFSDKNVLIFSISGIVASFAAMGLLILNFIIPAIVVAVLWFILATMVKTAVKNEYDDYEPVTKVMAVICFSLLPVLFGLYYLLQFIL